MTNPAKTVIRVNLEMAKEVAQEWERASYQELSAYCLEILKEIGFSTTELPENLQSREQQLNFITGFASYAFGEVLNVQTLG
ncbi:MAG: hypothetical protein C4323_24845 [Mastigocladus sp. ERB_26_2]|uniref:Uncharacterized protein n=1 Tax=Fischerella muscicola CCMEE 5323 TaxID=2019572 RepID=A0A2N6K000_FISMU|nr:MULTISPECIES: hypothetical protein [Fischerella]MBD2432043.1 hypothetical protein [Fischerella sp. FACHB-380]PLZ87166.1 hypothetical protein CEN44_18105 [Fischerella muscicola CCMEE 5323]